MKLNDIRRPAGNRRPKGRVGRGPGSGNGKTAGKGHKGARARSGFKHRSWFEGGQMPLNRRVPKRGFKNPFTRSYQIVNLRDLERVGELSTVDGSVLWEKGLIRDPEGLIKLLGDGQVSRAFTVEVDKASKAAVEAIEAAGGKVNIRG
jgi:large subunit ribosomal protein L15